MRITIRDVKILDEAITDDKGQPILKDGAQLIVDGEPIGPAYSSACDFDEVRRWFTDMTDDELMKLRHIIGGYLRI